MNSLSLTIGFNCYIWGGYFLSLAFAEDTCFFVYLLTIHACVLETYEFVFRLVFIQIKYGLVSHSNTPFLGTLNILEQKNIQNTSPLAHLTISTMNKLDLMKMRSHCTANATVIETWCKHTQIEKRFSVTRIQCKDIIHNIQRIQELDIKIILSHLKCGKT